MKNMANIMLMPLLLSVVSLLYACGVESGGDTIASERIAVPEKPNKILYLNAGKIFRDDNDTHLSAVEKIGIKITKKSSDPMRSKICPVTII